MHSLHEFTSKYDNDEEEEGVGDIGDDVVASDDNDNAFNVDDEEVVFLEMSWML